MAYLPLPAEAVRLAGTPEAEAAVRALLTDLAGRKEFAALRPGGGGAAAFRPGFAPPGGALPALPGLQLSGAQLFVQGFESPDTEYPRLLVNWQTGAGKSLAAVAIAHGFVRQYRARAALGEFGEAPGGRGAPPGAPAVFVVGFAARETLLEEMLRHPELGFVSRAEAAELRRARAASGAAGPASPEAKALAGLLGTLRRRATDREKGGYFRFYGYKEFAAHLIRLTPLGQAQGFDPLALYAQEGAEAPEEGGGFGERLAAAARRGLVAVDEALLGALRGGLLIADEIHNAYNALERNNYGLALQYALDALGAEAPRAVFLSATFATGSAAEVVDLLNLLVPRAALPEGAPLRRSDFFVRGARGEGGRAGPLALRPGALDRIAHLAAGRVSFLLDADVGAYPRRLFEGEEVPGVPYLRLTLCPMSPFHARTLAAAQAAAGAAADAGLAPDAYALYDGAFPNPAFPPDAATSGVPAGAVGLYRSGEVGARLAQAPEEWRAAAGVVVETGRGRPPLAGPFLGPGRLGAYSAKLAAVVAHVLEALRAGPGKVMVYHHRVRATGVLLIQEALREHGLADETSAPTDATLCAVCGAPRAAHPAGGGAPPGAAPHAYAPARFGVAHSDVERAEMLRTVARFNASENLEGGLLRVLVGSKVIREALSFFAVRRLIVASLPTDYATLVQIFGRVVRKGSHAELPPDQRDVRIWVLVSAPPAGGGGGSPELRRYAEKGAEYLLIQEVERALRRYAVDGFANWARTRAVLAGPGGAPRATLDALPFEPAVAAPPPGPPRAATFLAYGHAQKEVAAIAAACRALFRARPVWTPADLWAALRGGAVRGLGGDPAAFDEGNFALALAGLERPAAAAGGEAPSVVVRAGPFLVAARAGPGGPALDVESYLRAPPPPQAPVVVDVGGHLREARAGANFAVRLRAFEAAYLAPGGAAAPLELALVRLPPDFHAALLRALVAARAARPPAAVTADDARVLALYRRFRLLVSAEEAAGARGFRGAPGGGAGEPAGFLAPEAARLLGPDGAWYSAPLADLGVGRRHAENDVVVGLVVAPPGGAEAALKLRPPTQHLRIGRDARSLARGGVCETRRREELDAYARRLHDAAERAGLLGRAPLLRGLERPPRGGPAPPAGASCRAIRAYLLALEEAARAGPDGMERGTRWLYLPVGDAPPTISALAVAREQAR